MTRRRTRPPVLALGLALGLGFGSCHSGTYLLLTLTDSAGALTVDTLSIVVNNDTLSSAPVPVVIGSDVVLTDAAPRTVALALDDGRSGDVWATVTAQDHGTVVATATSTQATIRSGGTVDLTVDFAGASVVGGDLGAPDAAPDASAPDLAPAHPGPDHFDVTAGVTSVDEHQTFIATVTARDASGAPVVAYAGSLSLTCDWGDLTVVSGGAFVQGAATYQLSLDRETSKPAHPLAQIVATAGAATGSLGMTVTAPAWVGLDAAAVFGGDGRTWDSGAFNAASLTSDGATYHLLFGGFSGAPDAGYAESWGYASSHDGASWSASIGDPVFGPVSSSGGWQMGTTVSTFLPQYDFAHGFVAIYTGGPTLWGVARATDPSAPWSHSATGYKPTATGPCAQFDYNVPVALFAEPGALHVYFPAENGPCESISTDEGNNWGALQQLQGFPTYSSVRFPTVVAVALEGSVYKMFFFTDDSRQSGLAYATATDTTHWVMSPSAPSTFPIETVTRALDGGYLGLQLLQNGIGRVTRP